MSSLWFDPKKYATELTTETLPTVSGVGKRHLTDLNLPRVWCDHWFSSVYCRNWPCCYCRDWRCCSLSSKVRYHTRTHLCTRMQSRTCLYTWQRDAFRCIVEVVTSEDATLRGLISYWCQQTNPRRLSYTPPTWPESAVLHESSLDLLHSLSLRDWFVRYCHPTSN